MASTGYSKSVRPKRSDEEIAQLVRSQQGGLRHYLLALGCPESQVDDFLQDSFLRFLSQDIEDRGEQASGAYLRKIARNSYFQALRRQRRRPEVIDLAAAELACARYEGRDHGDSYQQSLTDCLARLGERSRRSLTLRYQENMTREEIGRELGLGESGVKSLLQRARRFLRECIDGRSTS